MSIKGFGEVFATVVGGCNREVQLTPRVLGDRLYEAEVRESELE